VEFLLAQENGHAEEVDMNLQSVSRSCFFLVLMGLLSWQFVAAEDGSSYGHVSFIEGQARVMRADEAQDAAVVNLPLVPGDTIATGDGGRCELQFDNGTVIRLDKNTRLRITTVQAPALTSRWKITSLHLLQGQLYALPQTYNEEVFQVITPHAAAKLESRAAATIRVRADQGTFFYSDGGKFEVLYGDDPRSLNKARVRPGQAFVVDNADRIAVSDEKRNLEFIAWNEYVNRHFKELHAGISKLPPKLKFEDGLLRYWAMTWSPVYGEWSYDEIFGYVWRPFSESFARFDRPFFDADYARINGRLYLVPRESWGWVPAHMGTWVWLKRGWTWVPGSYFHTGVLEFFAENGCVFPSFNYYFMFLYGNYDLWNVYQRYGRKAWQEEYYRQYPEREKMPPALDLLDRFPDELKKIFQRISRSPIAVTAAWLKPGLEQSGLDARMIRLPMTRSRNDVSVPGPKSAERAPGREMSSRSAAPGAGQSAPSRVAMRDEAKKSAGRDWNPDRRWAAVHGYSIVYSSARNAVLCPELKIASDRDGLPAGSRPGHRGLAEPFHPPVTPSQQPASGSVGLGPADANPPTGPGQAKAKDDSGK
jgi:hypothetical protein